MQTTVKPEPAAGLVPDPDFDLDVSIVETGPVIADLLCSTDDNCGQTCQSACTSCQS